MHTSGLLFLTVKVMLSRDPGDDESPPFPCKIVLGSYGYSKYLNALPVSVTVIYPDSCWQGTDEESLAGLQARVQELQAAADGAAQLDRASFRSPPYCPEEIDTSCVRILRGQKAAWKVN